MKNILVIAAALASTGTGAAACPGLEVQNAWIRQAPPGTMMTAAYARLVNTGKLPLVVDGASGKDFSGVELHQTQVQGGMSRMRPGTLTVPAGGSVALEPGGWHLMLFGMTRNLAAGDTVPLTLTCGQDASEFPFTVKAPE
jgi:hypothetical protein